MACAVKHRSVFGDALQNINHLSNTPQLSRDLQLQRAENTRRQFKDAVFEKLNVYENDPFISVPDSKLTKEPLEHGKFVLEQGLRLPWDRRGRPALNKAAFRESSPARLGLKPLTIRGAFIPEESPSRLSKVHRSPRSDIEIPIVGPEPQVNTGAHRDGYSEEKCRFVLIKHCSWIPRHFDYAEGTKRIYPILREYLGDENLDLATGVLYEMIEIPVDFSWEEGGSFQRWKYDHFRRDMNFENSHVPALGNIIVGSIIPTETLRRYRQTKSEPLMSATGFISAEYIRPNHSKASGLDLQLPNIRSQKDWQIEYSCFVSSPTIGTRVHRKPPSAANLHLMVWDGNFGRGGKLVNQREAQPSTKIPRQPYVDINTTIEALSSNHIDEVKSSESFLCSNGYQSFLKVWHTVGRSCTLSKSELFHFTQRSRHKSQVLHPRVQCGCDDDSHSSFSAKIYDLGQAVRCLPDPASENGQEYYKNVCNESLPATFVIPTESFVRKNDLNPKGRSLAQTPLISRCLSIADDLSIKRGICALMEAATYNCPYTFQGPFTNELFKDGGMDFHWQEVERSYPAADVLDAARF